MKKFFRGCMLVAMAAVFVAAGYTVVSHQGLPGGQHSQASLKDVGKFFGPSEACAHTGGACYLDDTNLSTVEGGCYAKCQRFYTVAKEVHACEVGCSLAISVATQKPR